LGDDLNICALAYLLFTEPLKLWCRRWKSWRCVILFITMIAELIVISLS